MLIPQDLGVNKQSVGPWDRTSGQSGRSHRESARSLIRSENLSYLAYPSRDHQNAFQLDPVKQEEGYSFRLNWVTRESLLLETKLSSLLLNLWVRMSMSSIPDLQQRSRNTSVWRDHSMNPDDWGNPSANILCPGNAQRTELQNDFLPKWELDFLLFKPQNFWFPDGRYKPLLWHQLIESLLDKFRDKRSSVEAITEWLWALIKRWAFCRDQIPCPLWELSRPLGGRIFWFLQSELFITRPKQAWFWG